MKKVNDSNNQVFLLLAAATSLTGFGDLSKVSVCLTHILSFETTLSLGFSLSTLFTLGSAITGLDLLIKFIDARNAKKRKGRIIDRVGGNKIVIERTEKGGRGTEMRSGNSV